jgi:hypothetical protein
MSPEVKPETFMRPIILCCLLLCLPSPALADTIADQAQRAYDLFAGGQSEPEFMSAHYGSKLFTNIGGRWARLSGPHPTTGIESYGADTEKLCSGPTELGLAAPDPLTLALTTRVGSNSFTQSYTLVAGSTFGEHTEAMPYLEAIGLGPSNTTPQVEQQRALALSLSNGLVQIYRPSDDVMVFTRHRGYPIVLVRCPAP